MNSQNQKLCPRCKKSDFTDFSSCRFCSTPYNWVKPRSQGAGIAGLFSSPQKMIVLGIVVIGPILFTGRNLLIRHVLNSNAQTFEETAAVLKNDPSNVEALTKQAEALAGTFLYLDAAEDYSKAIAVKPDSAELYRKRAKMYEYGGKSELAKLDLEKAASLGH